MRALQGAGMTVRRGLAFAAVASVSMALTACDVAMSPNPTLTSADASKQLVLKPGLWRSSTCADSAPATASCPKLEVSADGVSGLVAQKNVPPNLADLYARPQPYVIADGHPPVLQLRYPTGGALLVKGPDAVTPADQDKPFYVFLGLEPQARDAFGYVVRFKAWPVLCGPPAKVRIGQEGAAKGSPYPGPTQSPFEGVTPTGLSCTIKDRAALHHAADLSRTYVGPLMELHWVGDADSAASGSP